MSHLNELHNKFGFENKDLLEDVLHLLKTTKDARTSEQALGLLRTLANNEDYLVSLSGLEAFSDLTSVSEATSETEVPDWISKSFIYRLSQQLAGI